ncbi:ent-kaurene oxidase [Nannizzia gypsea CBS 118893]|uniref:Ent-kaurene oxidase n=1 Tax=Arthroderma gypseum (strain ATCC MYA-4604 / CBS 118893) TaxID=535722 RepID=E4UNL7_ARTGP|nr:ent-kaurene oxidase [Nannizzia gypsea CBS 118893]EFQ99625.1 ent-kaurene oxidase [Nannizzia gypsea CBS 118893]
MLIAEGDDYVVTVSLAFIIAFAVILCGWSYSNTTADEIPTINLYPWDWGLKKAHQQYLLNSRSLIKEGARKFNGPFRIITALGSRVILPPTYIEWLKGCLDLDHQALVHHEYFAGYPGMEGIGMITDPRHIIIDVTKKKLNQSSLECKLMQEHIIESLEDVWGNDQDWHTVDWSQNAVKFVARMSSAIFSGSDLSRNPEWQNLIITYTINTFMSVRALRSYPSFLHPLARWLLPECRKCQAQVRQARKILHPIIQKRTGSDDTFQWLVDVAAGRPFDQAAAQLAFAVAALHTTTELLKQTLLDICMHLDLVQPIRDEVEEAVSQHGWTTAGLFKMQILDSVIKESQRLKPGMLVNLERKALRDVILPSGMKLSKGTNVAVDSSAMWDPEIYPNPAVYDGYRFLRLRQDGNGAAALVSTSQDHFAFGVGKPICPGRFFAANELKVALANILLNYDVKIAGDREPKIVEVGFEMLCDPEAKLMVKRRPL